MNSASTPSHLCALLIFAAVAVGQPTPQPLEFEVASIKPHAPGETLSSFRLPSGGMTATNVTVRQLLLVVYDIQDFQLLGAPSWTGDDRWDIVAKLPGFVMPNDPTSLSGQEFKTIQDQMQERIRNLLIDRFQLKVRREMKEQPIYALVLAKGGPKITAAKLADGNPGVRSSMSGGMGSATFTSSSMEKLAQSLSSRTGRAVVDKTGLTGKFDFKLEWMAEVDQPGAVNTAVGADTPKPSGPSIFTAVQEQLGLHLEAQRGLVDVVSIERIEKPSPN
jgi:uncharacterized protein (TIGR03435 family)